MAHTGAFDMRFLQLCEAVAGVRFTHPSSTRCSYVIQPDLPPTGLEDCGAVRRARARALGDAIMTGEIFLKMLPLLAERGIVTLRDAREASQRTYLARAKY